MQSTVVFLCLSVCFTAWEINAQVGSLCRANERLLQCGCPKTCRNPAPDCKGVCKEGCFCEADEVRNDEGHCVKLADCPPAQLLEAVNDTSEPRINGSVCPEGEEYRFCEPCTRTCDNPNPVCPAQCARGCFCKGNLLRDVDKRCVNWGECSNVQAYIKEKEKEKNLVAPIPARFSCGPTKVYKKCEKCTRTCANPGPVCGSACRSGCVCVDNLLLNSDGKCVTEEDCSYDRNKDKHAKVNDVPE